MSDQPRSQGATSEELADKTRRESADRAGELFAELARAQTQAAMGLFGQFMPAPDAGDAPGLPADAMHWADLVGRMQSKWIDFQAGQMEKVASQPLHFSDPAKWVATAEAVCRQLPLADPETQKQLWEEGLSLFETVLGQYGIGPGAGETNKGEVRLPRSDHRFADPQWREQPLYALLHQTYLMLAEQITAMAENIEGLEPARKQQLLFTTRALIDALSPANFPLTNPVVMQKAVETKGESLLKGMEHLLADMKRGQLTHTSPTAFVLGENIASTPGKVIRETPLYQLIQYTPVTEKVLKTPLVIFPPWINRFYILDLNEKKSFVRWAVEQGISVFMVSWKSADETMAELVWDDYITAQIDAVDFVCDRLRVPSAHVVGYCVAGTTLAAMLAVLAKKGEADKIESATFFTAQVDFAESGDLKNFVDDRQIEALGRLASNGYVDGRYLAATFNMLRGNDLIWNYVERNYLKGEDYPAFDLLHWNGDYTNLPAGWHRDYLRDLYRDNRLVVPDSLTVCNVPVDLRRIETPCYIQAGREDHIAPAQSVWKLTRHLKGPWTFLLAGSGHIAGVVNPPSSNKYQYWINEGPVETLDEFLEGASEHPGSWWPHWKQWLLDRNSVEVAVRGKRKPGGRGDTVIEDAPGRYVKTR